MTSAMPYYIGWHYTPTRNLTSIIQNGLVRYPMRHEIAAYERDLNIPCSTGVMVFPKRQQGERLLGTLVFHAFKVDRPYTFEITELMVLYSTDNSMVHALRQTPAHHGFRAVHSGSINTNTSPGRFTFHTKERFDVVLTDVPPQFVFVGRHFNLMDVIQ